jgi:hypothetical protein
VEACAQKYYIHVTIRENKVEVSIDRSTANLSNIRREKKTILPVKGTATDAKLYTPVDLTQFFDKMEVDLKANLTDWHKVRREL